MSDRLCTCGVVLGPDWYVCRACAGRLRGLLSDLGGLMDALDAALGKQLRFGGGGGRRSADRPLPIDERAMESAYVARQTVLVWVDWVASVRGHSVPDDWPLVGRYLRDALPWLSRHPRGPEGVDELTDAIRQAVRTVDVPAERPYVGACPACGRPVHAGRYALTTECRYCGVEVDVDETRAEALRRANEHLVTTKTAEAIFLKLGISVNAVLIRNLRRRGLLKPTKVNSKGQPLYRVGDILARLGDTPS